MKIVRLMAALLAAAPAYAAPALMPLPVSAVPAGTGVLAIEGPLKAGWDGCGDPVALGRAAVRLGDDILKQTGLVFDPQGDRGTRHLRVAGARGRWRRAPYRPDHRRPRRRDRCRRSHRRVAGLCDLTPSWQGFRLRVSPSRTRRSATRRVSPGAASCSTRAAFHFRRDGQAADRCDGAAEAEHAPSAPVGRSGVSGREPTLSEAQRRWPILPPVRDTRSRCLCSRSRHPHRSRIRRSATAARSSPPIPRSEPSRRRCSSVRRKSRSIRRRRRPTAPRTLVRRDGAAVSRSALPYRRR